MATIGKLMVLWGTDISGLVSGNKKASKETRTAADSMKRSTEQAGKGFSVLKSQVLALAGVGGLGVLVQRSIASGDALAKVSDKLGIATERLAGLRLAADRSGVANSTLDMSLQRMTRRVTEAAGGTGEAVGALRELRLDAQALARMAPDEQFRAIAGAMGDVEGQGQKIRLAFKLFDSEGVGLVNTLAMGTAGLDEAQQEAERLGLALTRVDAAKLELVSDAGDRAKDSIAGIGNNIAVELSPYLSAAADKLATMAANSDGFRNEIQFALDVATRGVGMFADGLHGINIIWQGLKATAQAVSGSMFWILGKLAGSFEYILNGVAKGANSLIGSLNSVSGSNIPLLQMLDISSGALGMAESMFISAGESVAEMHRLMMEPLPSEQIREGMAALAADVQKRAEEIAQASARAAGGPMAEAAPNDAEKKKADTERKRIEDRLQMVRDATATEVELEYQRHEALLLALQEADTSMFEYEGERDALKEQLFAEHLQRLEDLRQKSLTDMQKFNQLNWKAQVGTVAGALEQMTAGVANSSKTMFKINKVAAIANAIVNTAAGVTQALAAYPPPISFVMAAAQLAVGVAQISAIKSAQFGSGTAPSQAATPATPVAPVAQENASGGDKQQITVALNSDRTLFSRDEVLQLMDGISEAVKDGANVGGIRVAYGGAG